MDSLIGKLRAIYNRLGRFGNVNPVSHSLIKLYLKFTREEQAGLAVAPKQAVPLFFTKFKSLIGHFRKKIAASASLSVVSKYILVRDAAFFVVDFFTGDRASDLGRLSCNQVFRLRDREGFLVRLSLTKKQFAWGLPVSLSSSLFETQMFVRFFGWIIMFVPAKRWGSPCRWDIFSEHPTVGGRSGEGHSLVRHFIIVYVCTCPKPNFVTGKRSIVSGSGFPTPLAFWAVLRKR